MCSRCKKPPKRSAAALNQFHGPFITEEIKPIFSFQFFTIIGPLLCHLSGCAWLGTRTHLFMSCGGPGALVSGLRGTVLSFLSSSLCHRNSAFFRSAHRKGERLDLKKDEDCQKIAETFHPLSKQKSYIFSTQTLKFHENIYIHENSCKFLQKLQKDLTDLRYMFLRL